VSGVGTQCGPHTLGRVGASPLIASSIDLSDRQLNLRLRKNMTRLEATRSIDGHRTISL
jgi:hypothetical protein